MSWHTLNGKETYENYKKEKVGRNIYLRGQLNYTFSSEQYELGMVQLHSAVQAINFPTGQADLNITDNLCGEKKLSQLRYGKMKIWLGKNQGSQNWSKPSFISTLYQFS